MFFGGERNGRRTRRIDLSGRSQTSTARRLLLGEARQQRQQRNRDRVRDRSARRICAVLRARVERRKAHDRVRAALSNLLLQTYTKQRPPSPSLSAVALQRLLRHLLFVFDARLDRGSLLAIATLLYKSLTQTDAAAGASYSTLLLDDLHSFRYQMQRFADLLLDQVLTILNESKSDLSDASSAARDNAISCLSVVLNPSKWCVRPSPADAEAVTGSVLLFLVKKGALGRIGDAVARRTALSASGALQREAEPLSVRAANVCCVLALRMVPISVDAFVEEFLCIPLLRDRLQHLVLEPIVKAIASETVWTSVARLLIEDQTFLQQLLLKRVGSGCVPEGPPYPKLGWLLVNVLDIGGSLLNASQLELHLSALASMINNASGDVFPPLQEEVVDDDSDSDAECIAPEQSYVWEDLHPRLRTLLQLFFDRRNLQAISQHVMSHVGDLDRIENAVKMLHNLIWWWPSRRNDLLSAIVFGSSLIPRLWTSLSSIESFTALVHSGNIEQMSGALSLFCSGYSHMLQVMDDDEFFTRAEPFSMPQVLEILAFLRLLLVRLFWSDAHKLSGVRWALHLRQAAASTFTQLRERQSRRAFAAESDWLMAGVELDDVVAQLKSRFDALDAAQGVDPTSLVDALSPVTIGERLAALLEHVPSLLSFSDRVSLFYRVVEHERAFLDGLSGRISFMRGRGERIRIRRGHVVEDGFASLAKLNDRLKGLVQVEFVDHHGNVEVGIDGGGLFKEFINMLSKEAFATQLGLFLESEEMQLYPNPNSAVLRPHDHLQLFRFLGMVVGKAVFEGITIEPQFSHFFLRKLLDAPHSFDDLRSLDAAFYRSMLFLKHFDGDFASLGLYFNVVVDELGRHRSIDLIPGGADVPVTASNRLAFMHLMANFKLNRRLRPQSDAFRSGLNTILQQRWLRLFSADELQMLISGSQQDIDLRDWQEHTVYHGFGPKHEVVLWFWEVLAELSSAQRAAVLKFCTSCSRAPLLGFAHLVPRFAVQRSEGTLDSLPTASTCANLLRLPVYTSKLLLKNKILYAVESDSGFALT